MKKYFNRFYNRTNIFKNLTKKMGNNTMVINSFTLEHVNQILGLLNTESTIKHVKNLLHILAKLLTME